MYFSKVSKQARAWKLFRCRAGRSGLAVVVGRQPLDHRLAVPSQALVVDEGGVQALEHAVHASRPFRDRRQLAHADEVATDAEYDGIAARQAPQSLQLH